MDRAPSTDGVAPSKTNGSAPEETKSDIDFFGDLAGGHVIYANNAVPGDVEAVRRHSAYAAALYLYVAVRYRAENVAEPPLRVVEKTDDGDEVLTDHPLLGLLDEPSPDYDLGELIELTQTYWDIHGDALWVKDKNLLGADARLTPFPAPEYDIESTTDRILGRFIVKTARGPDTKLPEDVAYFRYPNPGSRTRGLSPTDVALSWLNLGKRTTATIKGLLSNAMFPSVVISTHQEWRPDQEEFDRFKAQIDQFHTGPANAGKPFVTLGGGKATRVAFTLEDLIPGELLDRVETTVSSVFRIPPIVLGHLVGLKNSPWSQMEQAHRQAYQDAIQPLWRRWEKALTKQVLRPVDPDRSHRLAFDTSVVGALREDESQKITDAAAATFWTLNQRLVHTGQGPLPDGDPRGDFIEVVDGIAAAAPAPLDDGKSLAAKAAGEDRNWKWHRFDLMAKAQESTWETESYAQLKEDLSRVLKAVDSTGFGRAWTDALEKASAEDLETKAPDPTAIATLIGIVTKKLDLLKLWEKRLGPLVTSTGRTALKELSAELDVAFTVLEPTLLDYVRDETGWLIDKIDSTTRAELAKEFAAGLEAGESIPDLRGRLQDGWGFSRKRAELIARSETTRATVGAQRTAMSDYQADNDDQVVEKSWLSARDARVRPEHQKLDEGGAEEGWIGIDEKFSNGLEGPSEPRCRCSLLFRIEED